jgi:hypothetical protein
MTAFSCPYLDGNVELTDERAEHIAGRHPDLWPEYRERVAETLEAPDEVRKSRRMANARLISRWFESVREGKHVVVVVVSDQDPPGKRHWIITAYLARKLAGGPVEWKRN